MERKRLATDDDGHWYLIPADKGDEFEKWVFSDEAMDGAEPPEWVERLNMHPVNHTFVDWQEDK